MKYNKIRSWMLLFCTLLVFAFSEINAQKDSNIISDIEGNKYRTIVIGKQEWMAENLRTTKFNDGTAIPNFTDMTEWVRTISSAYCWYDNDISNKMIYGALYNWSAVNTGKLCPEGWRVPTDSDWIILVDYLGGSDIVVEKLERMGFSVIPGGYRYGYYWGEGIFYEKGTNSYWWTSTKATDTHIWTRTINKKNTKIYRSYFTGNNGFSVRCIKCD